MGEHGTCSVGFSIEKMQSTADTINRQSALYSYVAPRIKHGECSLVDSMTHD